MPNGDLSPKAYNLLAKLFIRQYFDLEDEIQRNKCICLEEVQKIEIDEIRLSIMKYFVIEKRNHSKHKFSKNQLFTIFTEKENLSDFAKIFPQLHFSQETLEKARQKLKQDLLKEKKSYKQQFQHSVSQKIKKQRMITVFFHQSIWEYISQTVYQGTKKRRVLNKQLTETQTRNLTQSNGQFNNNSSSMLGLNKDSFNDLRQIGQFPSSENLNLNEQNSSELNF